jgi:drug/metabolite transporter (DMT)-like permease
MFGPEILTIGSEITLALYPILIKVADQNLFRQLTARFATFFAAAVAFAFATGATKQLTTVLLNPAITIGLGLIYVLHVASSYFAFKELDAGTAMSLFYTYPFWNLLAGFFLFGESISVTSIILLIISLIGVYLVSKTPSSAPAVQQVREGFTSAAQKPASWQGILSGLLSALTETAVFAAMRLLSVKEPASPAAFIAGHSAIGTILAALASIFIPQAKQAVSSGTSYKWVQMILFNAIIGFGGYALRMYVIPRLTTASFSILSVIGAAAAFFWGWLYAEETPTIEKLIGAALITGAGAFTTTANI